MTEREMTGTTAPRILMLETSDPSRPYGGQSAFIRAVAPYLRGSISLCIGTATDVPPDGEIVLSGARFPYISAVRYAAEGRRPFLPVRLKAFLGVRRLRRQLLADCDIVYAHSPEMALPFVGKRRGRALVLHVHGNANPLDFSRYGWARIGPARVAYESLMRRVVRDADAVIAVDDEGAAWCRAMLPSGDAGRVRVVPTAVDRDWFAVAAARDAVPPHSIVFLGRLGLPKGTDVFMGATTALLGDDPSLDAVVAGEGSARPAMEAAVSAAGLTDRVRFTGWAAPALVRDVLREAAVLVLPSLSEGMPIAALEALAAGVPVVATPVGALPRIVRDGENGRLVAERTPEAFADAIRAVLDAPPSATSVSASVASFSGDTVAACLDGILADALAHARERA